MSTDHAHVTNGAVDHSTAPLSQEWKLANGQKARFEMPDMLAFANGSFDIPNQLQAEIFNLIYGNTSATLGMVQLNFDRDRLRGLYGLFAIVCVEPQLVLDDEDRQPGQLSPRQIGWSDLTAAYNFFRYGPPTTFSSTASEESKVSENVVDSTTSSK